ncbi:hypothetical protein PAHAL_8G163400 [Panicum hallii]|uniref:Uncharacterized protein n=1 Tax=Panicum hallii TaxID=206008 RepID=A0A2T8I920_9POAL|nr:uncharacterized protein LOC112902662 isoform X1 [Panicum hallii]PVH34173.1 hypothetical protein PAHAL_8G163400 [Panicum hallii]
MDGSDGARLDAMSGTVGRSGSSKGIYPQYAERDRSPKPTGRERSSPTRARVPCPSPPDATRLQFAGRSLAGGTKATCTPQKMDKKQQLLLYTAAAAAHMLLSMMAMVIQSRRRKRREPIGTDKSEGMSNGDDAIAESDGLNHGIGKSVINDDISSSSRPAKRAKTTDDTGRKTDCLVEAFYRGSQRLAKAIEKASNALPDGLFEAVDSLPGFELHHKTRYYHHLVRHPNDAHAFVNLPSDWKLSWFSSFVSENF